MPILQAEVEISEDRRLKIDLGLPEYLPAGRARVEIKIIPVSRKTISNPKSIMDFYGCFKGLNAFGAEGTDLQQKLRDEWQVFARHKHTRLSRERKTGLKLPDSIIAASLIVAGLALSPANPTRFAGAPLKRGL
jgi:hypothetical protein